MHVIELSDEEIFVIRAALEVAYDNWRKESGPAWEHVAYGPLADVERKLPRISDEISAESIFRGKVDNVLLVKLQRLDSDGKLSPDTALELVKEARRQNAELEDF